jgi:RHS repeat-associated protein
VTIHSVFDSDGRRIAEYNETSGAQIREYVWNGWEPVAVIEGGVISFVRADHIGRPVFATNAAGVKVWTATYTPFGGVHTSTGDLPTARFPGQWFQSESGLHQNWMRDYDPTTGRYLQADPLGLVDGASVYGYVKQNPGRWIDPRGLQTLTSIVGGIAGIDAGTPDPTDAAWPKWAVYGGALVLARAIDWCLSCPQCRTVSGKVVPVGTIGYRPLETPSKPQHGIVGPHHNIYVAQQNPNNCQCFWHPQGAVSPADLPSGAIPIEPFALP